MKLLVYVAGVACVLLSQVVLAAAFVGMGLHVRRAYGLTTLTLDHCFDAFWIGFSTVILALMLWNFVLPINVAVLLLVLAVGAAGLIVWRSALGSVLRAEAWCRRRVWIFAFAAAALWVANQGLGDMTYWDSALYHMQAVAWAERFPVVPGLANLFAPLAYNNASLLYSAMLDVGPWTGLGFRLANGLLMQALLLRIVLAIARLATGGDVAHRAREVFVALLFPAALSLAFFSRLSSYATAAPTAMVVLVIAERLFTMLARPAQEPRESAFDVVSITILSAACVALKLSAIVYCALAGIVAVFVWLSREPAPRREGRRLVAWALGAALLVGGAWTTRGVILSGYPAFPSRVVAAPVDWRAPAEHADAEYALVEHSSKASTMLDDVIAGRDRWGWVGRWTQGNLTEPYFVFLPLAVALGAAILIVARRARAARRSDGVDKSAWLLLPVFGALIAWFLLAPEGRYAAGFCWALAALAGVHAWKRRSPPDRMRPALVPMAAMATALITMVAVPGIVARKESGGAAIKMIIKQNVKLWESQQWMTPITPPPLTPYYTQSGVRLMVPRGRCWNTPIPCTPNPAPNLELRDSLDLARGFRVRGAWAMQDWPSTSRPRFLEAWRQSRTR